MAVISENDFEKGDNYLINKKEIETISEYLDYTNFFSTKWNDLLWYRGSDNNSFELAPSVYRNKYLSATNMSNEFIRYAKILRNEYNKYDKWEWYQLQQHYGLPTRLLDWTQGSLIALYFAVRKPTRKNIPCVWILNPNTLNRSSKNIYGIFYTDSLIKDKHDEITNRYLVDGEKLPELPIAILPPHIDQRMRAQKSAFTVHGTNKSGLDKLKFTPEIQLAQIGINTEKIKEIKSELVSCGISESTLFPDLEGLARELKEFYFHE